jgi:hypothetical protein
VGVERVQAGPQGDHQPPRLAERNGAESLPEPGSPVVACGGVKRVEVSGRDVDPVQKVGAVIPQRAFTDVGAPIHDTLD